MISVWNYEYDRLTDVSFTVEYIPDLTLDHCRDLFQPVTVI